MTNPARQSVRASKHLAMGVFALAACWPVYANAQAAPSAADTSAWRFRGTIYGYFPSLGGSASVPTDPNGVAINVDADKIIDNLKFTLMGTLDVHKAAGVASPISCTSTWATPRTTAATSRSATSASLPALTPTSTGD